MKSIYISVNAESKTRVTITNILALSPVAQSTRVI
jgi:hypothetical protein